MKRRLVKLEFSDMNKDKVEQAMDRLDDEEDIDFEDVEGYDEFTVMDKNEEKIAIQQILDVLDKLNCDTKRDRLVESIKAIKTDKPNAKLVVFTEYRDTLEYLLESLEYNVGKIDGTMSIDEREKALEDFRNPNGYDVMLCTDAAGEGIDMQFCNVEINYDLPWNPNRLEQRMGRIHRIGQDQNVSYYNFVVDAEYSIDGYIMRKLLDKIEQIKESMGDTVYDVIGLLVKTEDIGKYYEELRQIPHDQWEPKIQALLSTIESTKKDVEEKRKMLLEGNRLDATALDTIQNIRKTAVVIEEVKRFISTFVESSGGRMELLDRQKGVYKIRLSAKHAQELDIDEIIGVFDADTAQKESYDYLALGNSRINSILNKAASDHVASLGHETQDGVLCIYKIIVRDGDSKHQDAKIIALFEHADGIIDKVDERSIWTYKHSDERINLDSVASASSRMSEYVSKVAKDQKDRIDKKLLGTQDNVIRACTGYYAKKIGDINDRIQELEQNEDGPHIEKIIDDKNRSIKTLQGQITKEKEKIRYRYKTDTKIELIGIAQVTPDDGADIRIRIDEAGMKAVIVHENERATSLESKQHIEDCSKKNCGYDVESFDRKIEVKSHKTTGSIMLTDHEWKTAERLKEDYWLYVVEDVFSEAMITEIQNPSEKYQLDIERIPKQQFRWVVHNWKRRLEDT